ncbi:hypothetical protein PROFUN_11758, partial [Planoprotostelium fungivorum]
MFESVISETLIRYLGSYFKGLDPSNFEFVVWGGDMTLTDLQLRVESLNHLDLPIHIKSGYIRKLKLKIPWLNIMNLRNQPLVIRIEKLFLLTGPKMDVEIYNEDREQEIKQEKLHLAEKIKKEGASTAPAIGEQRTSVFTRMMNKIVDNIQFSVDDVHVRYEDAETNPDRPMSFGFTLEHLSAESVDENWTPTFLNLETLIHKIVNLKNISLYWNPSESNLYSQHQEDMTHWMDSFISRGKASVHGNHYIIQPFSASLKLIINKGSDTNEPMVTARFELEEDVQIEMEEIQFQQIQNVVEGLSMYKAVAKRPSDRPNGRDRDVTRKWWKFAAECILLDIRARNFQRSWLYMQKRKEDRDRYIQSYRGKLKRGTNSSEVDELERIFTFEDILFFRSLAEAQNRVAEMDDSTLPTPPSINNNNASWYSYIYRSTSNSDPLDENWKKMNIVDMNEEQRKVYLNTVEYSSEIVHTHTYDDQVVLARLMLDLPGGSLRLKTSTGRPIAKLQFNGLNLDWHQRSTTFLMSLNLGTVGVIDEYTPGTLYRDIIGIFDDSSSPTTPSLPLLNIEMEDRTVNMSNPGFRMYMHMSPLQLIYSPVCTDKITSFFTSALSSSLMDEIVIAARRQYASGTNLWSDLILQHQSIDINVDLNAPKIYLPQNVCDRNGALLVLDLGSFTVDTVSVDKTETSTEDHVTSVTPRGAKRHARSLSTDFGPMSTNDDYYDKFKVSLSQIQLFLEQGWATQPKHQLIEKFDINFSLYLCKLTDLTVPQFKLFGDLPSLVFLLSTEKVIRVLSVLKTLIVSESSQQIMTSVAPGSRRNSVAEGEGKREVKKKEEKKERSWREKSVNDMILDTVIVECQFSIPRIALIGVGEDETNVFEICASGLEFEL